VCITKRPRSVTSSRRVFGLEMRPASFIRTHESAINTNQKFPPIHRYTFSACKIVCGTRNTGPEKRGGFIYKEIAMGNRDKRGKEPKKPKQPPKPPPLIS
jgi:hypothetical protein